MGFLNNRHRPDLDNHGKELFYGYLHDGDLESALKIWEESTPLSRLAEVAFCEETLELELKQDPKRLAVIRQCDEDIKRMMRLGRRKLDYQFGHHRGRGETIQVSGKLAAQMVDFEFTQRLQLPIGFDVDMRRPLAHRFQGRSEFTLETHRSFCQNTLETDIQREHTNNF